MNALVASNKENTHQGGNVKPTGTGKREKKPRKKKALCPNCKCFVLHKPELCYELEANKAERYPGWKSIFVAAPIP